MLTFDRITAKIQTLDYVNVAANLAPVLVPLAPATVAVIGMADGLARLSGWAYIPAIVSGAGMEMVGMSSAHLLTTAIINKHWGRGLVSGALLLAYAAFAVVAISHAQNSEMFASFVCLSIVGYLAGALWRYNANEQAAKEKATRQAAIDRAEAQTIADHNAALALAETKRQILLLEAEAAAEKMRLDAETRKQNSANRGAKIGASRPNVQNGQVGHAPAPRHENVEAVRGWFANNAGSDRQAAKDLKLSPSTVKACKDWIKSHEARPAV